MGWRHEDPNSDLDKFEERKQRWLGRKSIPHNNENSNQRNRSRSRSRERDRDRKPIPPRAIQGRSIYTDRQQNEQNELAKHYTIPPPVIPPLPAMYGMPPPFSPYAVTQHQQSTAAMQAYYAHYYSHYHAHFAMQRASYAAAKAAHEKEMENTNKKTKKKKKKKRKKKS